MNNNNYLRTAKEWDEDFDLQEEKAAEILRQHTRISGMMTFFMDECPNCGRTMPFEFDEGACMICHCDPCAGVVEDMTDEEFEELIKDNTYHMEIPELPRMPFETLPQVIQRQLTLRYEEAMKTYNKANSNAPLYGHHKKQKIWQN